MLHSEVRFQLVRSQCVIAELVIHGRREALCRLWFCAVSAGGLIARVCWLSFNNFGVVRCRYFFASRAAADTHQYTGSTCDRNGFSPRRRLTRLNRCGRLVFCGRADSSGRAGRQGVGGGSLGSRAFLRRLVGCVSCVARLCCDFCLTLVPDCGFVMIRCGGKSFLAYRRLVGIWKRNDACRSDVWWFIPCGCVVRLCWRLVCSALHFLVLVWCGSMIHYQFGLYVRAVFFCCECCFLFQDRIFLSILCLSLRQTGA